MTWNNLLDKRVNPTKEAAATNTVDLHGFFHILLVEQIHLVTQVLIAANT